MKSPAYWNAFFYELFIKLIWRKMKSQEISRWKRAFVWVPSGSQVIEVAAGTGQFYREMLSNHVKTYIALDINPAFVKNMKSKGINAVQADLRKDPIPAADIVIIISALYHFKSAEPEFVNKLLSAARERVIIVEPVSRPLNKATFYDKMRARLVDIGEGPIYQRYSVDELLNLCRRHAEILHYEHLPGNEFLIVLCRGDHAKDS
jgi:uncharacterized UPF0146 family protein